MTTRTDGAELRFTRKAGPVTPVNSAKGTEPGIVKMNGKDYRITLEIQVNGAWKKVDPNHFSDVHLKAIADKCEKIYQTTTHEAGQPKTLTVYFEQKNLSESWKSAILGKVSNRYKDEVVDLTFKKIEYKTAGSNELHVFDVQTHEFSTQADAVKVNQLASSMKEVSKAIFGNREGFIEQPKKIKPPSEAERSSEKLAAIKRALNVQEAGTRENRCMTLSIAAILLKASLDDLQAAADEFNIPLAPQDGDTPLITLSNGLIELAAKTIETDNRFTRPDTEDDLNGHFRNIVAALTDGEQVIADETNRKAVVQQYAALIRQPQMLDIPVLDALEMNGIPLISLVPSNGDLVLGSVSHTITFDEHGLDTYDLTTICFVVRDGLHYQPVIMDNTPNIAQQEKLRSILKNEMEKTLRQIQNLMTDPRASAVKSVEFNQLVSSVVNKYPIDAKPKIVQLLRDARRTIGNDLISQRNDLFAMAATHAFLSNPRLIVEENL